MLASISCSNLSYVFTDGTILFKGINLFIGCQRVGLVGVNGIGKSTLLKLIQGGLKPTQGVVQICGQLEVLCKRAVEIPGETVEGVLGVRQIFCALDAVQSGRADSALFDLIDDQWDIKEKLALVLERLKINHLSLSQPMETLSGGESIKVHLARIILKSPAVLLLDEPTNNLDSEGHTVLYDFIENWGGCLLVVSHDRELLSKVDAIFELSKQGLQKYGGNYVFYEATREVETFALEKRLLSAEQKIKSEKRKLQRHYERQAKRMHRGQQKADKGGLPKITAGGLERKSQITLAKSKAMHEDRVQKAVTDQKRVRDKIKERNFLKVDFPETRVPNGRIIFQLNEFNFRFYDSGSFLFEKSINFTLCGAKRVAISGDNGAGKSTLFQLLLKSAGLLAKPLEGEQIGKIELKTDRVACLDQRVDILYDDLTVLENLTKVTPHIPESDRRIRLKRFLFDRNRVNQKAFSLSGGERLRAGLACVLFSEKPPWLLILDEPTNNLDLDSIEQIESALSNFKGAILVASHDRRFLKNIGIDDEIFVRKLKTS